MEKVMAVVTKEEAYAERFCDYVNRKKVLLLTAVPFGSVEACSSYSENHHIELLILDRELDRNGYRAEKKVHHEIHAAHRLYLGTPSATSAVHEEGTGFRKNRRASELNKYQSADELLEEIIGVTGEMEILRASAAAGHRLRIIGIYSPISRCGKTSFAVTLCRDVARRNRVLYLNLDEFASAASLLQVQPADGISEAVYQLRQGKLDAAKISALTLRVFNFDWIPPVSTPADAAVIRGEDYLELINTVIRATDYDCVVIDMNRYVGQADTLMDLCDVVYVPVQEDFLSARKAEEFFGMLEHVRGAVWSERLKRITLPENADAGQRSSYADTLLYGAMGDFVRELKEA